MTSRERVEKALQRKEPDRVPIDLGSTHNSTIHLEAHENLKKYLGFKGGKVEFVDMIQQAVRVDERIREKFQIDTYGLWPKAPRNWEPRIEEDEKKYYYTDEWGVSWQKPKEYGFYFDLLHSPLENAGLDDLKNLNWPDPDDPGRIEGLAEEAQELYQETDYALVGDLTGGCVEELIWFQTGLVRYLTDMLLEPSFIRALIEKSLVIQKRMIYHFLSSVSSFIQVVAVNGDLGGQENPLISPKLYSEFLKPYEREVFSFIRKQTKVNIFRHTCGNIRPLIPDLIDIGIETLNPIQVSARDMNTAELKEEFGDKLNFWGGIDNHILAWGTTKEVEEEVKRRIRDLAPGGGYVLGAVHNIQRDVSPQNVCAMIEAARKYGEYPIRI